MICFGKAQHFDDCKNSAKKTPKEMNNVGETIEYGPCYSFEAHKKEITSVKYSPDGNLLATSSLDGSILIYNTISLCTISEIKPDRGEKGASGLSWSPDSKQICSCSNESCFVRVFEARSGRQTHRISFRSMVATAEFSLDGNRIAVASVDPTVNIFDLRVGRVQCELIHPAGVSTLSFRASDQCVLTGCLDGGCRLWNSLTGEQTGEHFFLDGNEQKPIISAKFSPNGKRIISTSSSPFIRYWDPDDRTASSTRVFSASGLAHPLRPEFLVLDQNEFIMCGTVAGSINTWDAQGGRDKKIIDGNEERVLHISPHPSISYAASAGDKRDGRVKIWCCPPLKVV